MEETGRFVQYTPVSGTFHVMTGDKWKPQKIIGYMGSHTASCRRVPPVLYVSFPELPRCAKEDVLACQVGFSVNE